MEGGEVLRAVLDAVFDPCLVTVSVRDASGCLVDLVVAEVNESAAQSMRMDRSAAIGTSLRSCVPAPFGSDLVQAAADVIGGAGSREFPDAEYRLDDSQTVSAWFDVRIVRVGDGAAISWRDVTHQHVAYEQIVRSEARFRLLAENATDVVCFADEHGRASWVAPNVSRTLGWSVDELIGTVVTDLVHPDDWDVVLALNEVAATGTDVVALRPGMADPVVARLRQKDGSYRSMSITATRVREIGDSADGMVVGMRDVEELVATKALAERGRRDDLTGLVNRPFLLERMESIIAESRRTTDKHAVLYCDVDYFKEINDTYGHAVGDEVLRTIATRIRATVRDDDVVARLGGDEFVVVLKSVADVAAARVVAEKIRCAVGQALVVDGIDLARSFSIGIAMVRPDSTPDRVLRDADAALYEAKESGRDRTITHEGHQLAI